MQPSACRPCVQSRRLGLRADTATFGSIIRTKGQAKRSLYGSRARTADFRRVGVRDVCAACGTRRAARAAARIGRPRRTCRYGRTSRTEGRDMTSTGNTGCIALRRRQISRNEFRLTAPVMQSRVLTLDVMTGCSTGCLASIELISEVQQHERLADSGTATHSR